MSAAALQATANQNIVCAPRFFIGVKADVRNSVFYIDDDIILYPCGHNIILYSISDRS